MTPRPVLLHVMHIRPGVFQIATPDLVATVDAEAYTPEVVVRYAAGVGAANGCNPVYSREERAGVFLTVVNANPSFTAVQGEQAAVDMLFRVADWYRDRLWCSCKQRVSS